MGKSILGANGHAGDSKTRKAEILARLDLAAEFAAMGVEFTKAHANAKGWRECRALGREDRDPSAAVHLPSGHYKSYGAGAESLTFWDFAVKYGNFGDFKDVLRHFEAKAGLGRHPATHASPPAHGSKSRRGASTYKAAVANEARKIGGAFVADWAYHAADGEEWLRVVRFQTGGKKGKSYRPFHIDPMSGWVCGDPPGPLPLYRLPELLASGARVWVGEGEKVADLIAGLGLIATTSAHGAGSAKKTDWSPLAGREVVILPDNDRAGADYASEVLGILSGIDPRPSAKVLRLPDLPEHGDFEQWWGALPDRVDDVQARALLLRLADEAPSWDFNRVVAIRPGGEEDDHEDEEIIDRWPRIDACAFHGIAGDIVRMADPHTEADPVATLIQFLVAFGNMLGRGPHFVVGATRHFLNLFCVLVGMTALGRKGTSWDIARWILEAFDHEWADWRIQSGLVSGEGLIFHVRDESKRDDAVVDAGERDKRLLVVETELGRTLKAMNRETNTLSDVIRQAWDSGNLRTLAKNHPVKATGAHISIIGHATQADVRRHLTETDSANGFANRFLWAAVRRSKELPDGGNLFTVDWAPIHRRMVDIVSSARRRGEMVRDPGARELWHAAYGELSAGKVGLLGAILSRAEAQTMRLACLFALLDGSDVVRAGHLTAALALWDYCQKSARLVFGDSLSNPDAEKLFAALRAAPEGLTRKQITVDVFSRNKKREHLSELLSDLLTAGLIHRQGDPSTGGRPTERWLVGGGPRDGTN